MKKLERKKTITGVLSKHRKGFGFVAWDENSKDIYIGSKYMGSAMDGDTVVVELLPAASWRGTSGIRTGEGYRPARPEGRIIAVKKRKLKEVPGTFRRVGKSHNGMSFVIPAIKELKEEIYINAGADHGAIDGDKVVVKLTQYPDRYRRAEGKITEIISKAGEPGGDIKLIARSYGMKEGFPAKARAEARDIKAEHVGRHGMLEDAEIRKRRDLRKETIFCNVIGHMLQK
ncbi:MAG: hypothetical protein Q4A65_04710 [Bacillota bacterium]|nr:hypothetical protein [Bacillota bacterium]